MSVIALGFFLLSALSPWVGTWQLEVGDESLPQASTLRKVHLVIHSPSEVQLYDSQGYPLEVAKVQLDDDSFEIRAFQEGLADVLIFSAARHRDSLKGSLKFAGRMLQYQIEQTFTGRRWIAEPATGPREMVQEYASEGSIDLVAYLQKQSHQNFDDFLNSWRETEARFYFIFKDILPAGGLDAGQVRFLHENLEDLKEQPAEASKPDGMDNQYVVLMPPLEDQECRVLQLATHLNEYPGGREPCCGETRYSLESFLLQPYPSGANR